MTSSSLSLNRRRDYGSMRMNKNRDVPLDFSSDEFLEQSINCSLLPASTMESRNLQQLAPLSLGPPQRHQLPTTNRQNVEEHDDGDGIDINDEATTRILHNGSRASLIASIPHPYKLRNSDSDDDSSYDNHIVTPRHRKNRSVLLLMLMIFLFLTTLCCYLVILGHDILHELKQLQRSDASERSFDGYDGFKTDRISNPSRHDRNNNNTIAGSWMKSSALTRERKSILPVDNTVYHEKVTQSTSSMPSSEDTESKDIDEQRSTGITNDQNPIDKNNTINILIVYGPEDDQYQQEMATFVAEGAKSVQNNNNEDIHIDVEVKSIVTASFTTDVLRADAIIIGTSVENSNVHHLTQEWININWDLSKSQSLKTKVGSAFVTAGGLSAGEESTMLSLIQSMLIFNMVIVGGLSWTSSFGASAITYETPFDTSRGSSSIRTFGSDTCYDKFQSYYPDDLFETDEQRKGFTNFLRAVKDVKDVSDTNIHPMFLAKAYGLGIRVATVTKQLNT